MQCEICGEGRAVLKANVDGTNFEVCEKCSRFGKIIHKPEVRLRSQVRSFVNEKTEQEILPDFAQRIRQAREKAGLSRKEFAQKLNETQGVIEQLESGKRLPNLKVAKKIETQFRIRLIGSVVEPETTTTNLPEMTLGDRVVIKKKGPR